LKLKRFDAAHERPPFCCGDEDLDEFFSIDSIAGAEELLSVTYGFLSEDDQILGFFSVSNDSIKKEDVPRSAFKRLIKNIPSQKRYSSMPSVKIGRLGICEAGQRSGLGTQILDYLKAWFTLRNKTGCRFLVVDAYNTPKAIGFYEKNLFSFLTSSDEKEKTRIMYFDLKRFRP
jgi:GNAT superfamily N-acetyltransferase